MRRFVPSLCLLSVLCSASAWAQGFDPRVPLGELIQAFQNCGPPAAYQMLSPELFRIIGAQTGGTGCYPQIRQAGPILSMEVEDQKTFPNGPVYVIRVTHSAGAVDWFIGFDQSTGRVALLTFQPAASSPPTVRGGPEDDSSGGNPGGGGGGDDHTPHTKKPSSTQDGCSLYPAMC